MNKIGFQIQAKPNGLEAAIDAHPASIKLLGTAADLDLAREIRARSPGTTIVIRGAGGDQDYRKPAQAYADYLTSLAEPFQRAGVCDYVEHVNEPGLSVPADAQLLNEHAVEFCRIMHSRGFKVIVYNFSVGVPKNLYLDGPTLTAWPLLKDGVAAADMLGLHEYSAPRMRDGQGAYCLRYRHVLDELGGLGLLTHIALTEIGIDRGILPGQGGGYKNPANRTTASDYIDDLKWYAGELAKDAAVQFAHVFLVGSGSAQWTTFDVADDENDRAQFIAFLKWSPAAGAPTPTPTPTGGAMLSDDLRLSLAWNSVGVAWNPSAAFQQYALAHQLGRPVGNETTTTVNGVQYRTQGFELAFVQCIVGDWGNLKAYAWTDGKEYVPGVPVTPPPVVVPPTGGPTPYSFPDALTQIGAVGEEGKPTPGQPFYRLNGATVRRGISAFMVVTVIGSHGVPVIGKKVINLFPDGNGEVIETDGSGVARFQFAASSAFSNPGSGPFTVFIADDSAFKDSDSTPKRVVYQARLSDIAHSLGDYQGTHTEISIQFIEQP